MANDKQARDGKSGLVWLLDVDNGTEVTTKVNKGDVGFVLTKASASSAFGALDVKTPIVSNKEITLASGDKFLKCTPYFCGFATSKSVSYSKTTQDTTCDYDTAVGKTNNATDGVVTTSGSLSGMNMLYKGSSNAVNKIKSRFGSIIEIDADGSITKHESDTMNKDVILIVWNYRDVKATGDVYDIEILPVLFTSLSKGAQYGSSQNFDLDFDSSATDENGFQGGNIQLDYVEGTFAGNDWSVAR